VFAEPSGLWVHDGRIADALGLLGHPTPLDWHLQIATSEAGAVWWLVIPPAEVDPDLWSALVDLSTDPGEVLDYVETDFYGA
jgi:hypothetical protein